MAAIPQIEVISREPNPTHNPTPLLFVHGAWHGAWCWEDHFLPYFAEHGYSSHAMSLRGHGKSTIHQSLKWVRMSEYVADVAQAAAKIEAQVGRRPVVIAHSMGGWVAQKYIEKHQAPGVVLMTPMPAKGTLYASLRVFRRDPLGFLRIQLEQDLYPVVENVDKATYWLFAERQPKEIRSAYQARLQSEAYVAYLQTVPQMLRSAPKNPPPVLVLSAERDPLFSAREGEQTARFYRGTHSLIHDATHDLMLDPHWQVAADRILAWLQECGF